MSREFPPLLIYICSQKIPQGPRMKRLKRFCEFINAEDFRRTIRCNKVLGCAYILENIGLPKAVSARSLTTQTRKFWALQSNSVSSRTWNFAEPKGAQVQGFCAQNLGPKISWHYPFTVSYDGHENGCETLEKTRKHLTIYLTWQDSMEFSIQIL